MTVPSPSPAADVAGPVAVGGPPGVAVTDVPAVPEACSVTSRVTRTTPGSVASTATSPGATSANTASSRSTAEVGPAISIFRARALARNCC